MKVELENAGIILEDAGCSLLVCSSCKRLAGLALSEARQQLPQCPQFNFESNRGRGAFHIQLLRAVSVGFLPSINMATIFERVAAETVPLRPDQVAPTCNIISRAERYSRTANRSRLEQTWGTRTAGVCGID